MPLKLGLQDTVKSRYDTDSEESRTSGSLTSSLYFHVIFGVLTEGSHKNPRIMAGDPTSSFIPQGGLFAGYGVL